MEEHSVCICFLSLFFFIHLGFVVNLQREKKNLQDLNGVYVFNVPQRECIDRPTARLIKDFDLIEGSCLDTFFIYTFITQDLTFLL